MSAILCIFFPPVISLLIWYKLNKESEKLLFRPILYFLYCFLNNLIIGLITVYGFGYTGSFTLDIEQKGVFQIHYMALAFVISILLPTALFYYKKYVNISVEFTGIQKVDTGIRMKGLAGWLIKNREIIVFWCIALLVIALNGIKIFDNDFWGDEAYSILLVNRPWLEVIKETAGSDMHPPLYYLILKMFCVIFGYQSWVYHFTSFVPLLLLIVMAYKVLLRNYGLLSAVVFVLLSGLSECAVAYNVEVRMYSWALFFVTLCMLYGINIVKKSSFLNWSIFVLLGLAAAYTHYYGLIVVFFIYLGVFCAVVLKNNKMFKYCVLSGALTILLYSPWLIIFFNSVKSVSREYWISAIPTIKELTEFIFGYQLYGVFLSSIFTILLAIFFTWKRFYEIKLFSYDNKIKIKLNVFLKKGLKLDADYIGVLICCMAFCGTIFVGIAASYLIRPVFISRYLYVAAGLIWLSFSIMISRVPFRKVFASVLIVSILFFGIKSYGTTYKYYSASNIATKETLSYFSKKLKPEDILITDNGHFNWTVLEYYFPENKIELYSSKEWKKSDSRKWLLLNGQLNSEEEARLKKDYKVKYVLNASLAGYGYSLYLLDKK